VPGRRGANCPGWPKIVSRAPADFAILPAHMKSMTGYGWGECSQNGFKVTVELSSVNRKQSEISINLPRELEVLEAQVRDEINQRIARGRLTARITMHAAEGREATQVRVNGALATAYARELRKLAKELRIKDDLSLDHLVRAPGVFETADEVGDAETFWPAVNKALQLALAMLVKMRTREGSNLKRDLSGRIGTMRKAVTRRPQGLCPRWLLPLGQCLWRKNLQGRTEETLPARLPLHPHCLVPLLSEIGEYAERRKEASRDIAQKFRELPRVCR
jgi:sRNA-binding carbon storage regulator CsrA